MELAILTFFAIIGYEIFKRKIRIFCQLSGRTRGNNERKVSSNDG
jgi:hypothetical protein